MVFSSISFLIFFLPCLLITYFCVPKRLRRARNIILLLFSIVFYAYGGVKYLLLLIVSVTINYFCGLMAGNGRPNAIRRLGVVLALVMGLGLLAWFKYSGFFAEILVALGAGLPVPEVVLPVGISFYTFQGLSYVIDVYRGDAGVQKNPINVALYVTMFPQLVAGPIVRYTTVAEEIVQRNESLDEFSAGAVRFMLGLAKKMILANAMGTVADGVFGMEIWQLSTAAAWVGAVGYTLQIYFDFSAYSDMAIGLGRMFGFHFLENFNYPYIAATVTEFWRRWHISLSTWFRDYLYIPLGGNRCSRAKNIRNLLIVWFLTGMWHGAAWTFIVWGLWFCLFLIGEKYIWGSFLERCPKIVGHVYTMLIVILSWVFFRSGSMGYALEYIGRMFSGGGKPDQAVFYILEYWPEWVLGLIAVFPVKNAAQSFLEKRKDKPFFALVLDWGPKILALALLAVSYLKLSTGSFNPFIYYQF